MIFADDTVNSGGGIGLALTFTLPVAQLLISVPSVNLYWNINEWATVLLGDGVAVTLLPLVVISIPENLTSCKLKQYHSLLRLLLRLYCNLIS